MKLKLVILTAFSAFFVAQDGFAATTPDLQYSNINAAKYKDTPVQILGGGFSTDMQSALGISCLKDGVIKYGDGGKAVIEIGDQKSFAELEADLEVNVDSVISIGQFSLDAAAIYARHVKEDAYSEGFYYFENIILPTKIFLPAGFGVKALNDFGQMAYQAGSDQFRYSCGDEFVQQEPIGAKFITSLKLNFASANDKTTFDVNVKGKIGDIFSASAAIQQAINQYHISGTMEVSAYQEGGDPTHLANIFSRCGDHYCVATCSLSKLDDCKGVIDGVIKYAQTDLIHQVDFKDGKVIGNPQPLGYSHMSYNQIGLSVGDSQVTPEITAARHMLGELFKTTSKNAVFIDHLLESKYATYFDADAHKALQNGVAALHNNLSILNDAHSGAIACYLHPDKCVAIAKTINQSLQPFDEKVMQPFNNGYYLTGLAGSNIMVPMGNDHYFSLINFDYSRCNFQYSPDLASAKLTYWIGSVSGWGTLTRRSDGCYAGPVSDSHAVSDYYTFCSILNPS